MTPATLGPLPIDPDIIRPAVNGRSDRWSWNLYRYLHNWRRKRASLMLRVYHIPGDPTQYMNPDPAVAVAGWDPATTGTSGIRLGHLHADDGWLSGSNLSTVLNDNGTIWSFHPGAVAGATDITLPFFDAYLRLGRCLFDPRHTQYLRHDEGRWQMDGDSHRRCTWCGHQQQRHIEQIVTTRESWRAIATAPTLPAREAA